MITGTARFQEPPHGGHMSAFLRIGSATGLLALIIASPIRAQNNQAREAAVVATLQKLFDGMRSRDAAAMRSVFDPSAKLINAATRDGQTTIRAIAIDDFVNSIMSAPADAQLIERIYSPEVRIDGNLATFWAFYTFHLGEQFSHCGVDTAQLFETSEGWKIVSLADTRRREGCDPPKN